jgi:hypothetical protein
MDTHNASDSGRKSKRCHEMIRKLISSFGLDRHQGSTPPRIHANYSVKEQSTSTCMRRSGHLLLHSNTRYFAWLALRYRLWTSDRRHRHGLQDHIDPSLLCLQQDDTVCSVLMPAKLGLDVSRLRASTLWTQVGKANWSLGGRQLGVWFVREIEEALIPWSS